MASESKIGSVVYRCEKVAAADGLRLFVRVSQFFAPAPGLMASIGRNADKDIAPSKAFLVLSMSEGADPDQMQEFLTELVGMCTIGGDPAIIGHKPPDMATAIEVAWFAMRTQFADFLGESLKGG